jgi:hypothetical protein
MECVDESGVQELPNNVGATAETDVSAVGGFASALQHLSGNATDELERRVGPG